MKIFRDDHYRSVHIDGLKTLAWVAAVLASVFFAGVVLGVMLTQEKCNDATQPGSSGTSDAAPRPRVHTPWI